MVCHDGVCPPCPRSVSRGCPCGKTSEEVHTHTHRSNSPEPAPPGFWRRAEQPTCPRFARISNTDTLPAVVGAESSLPCTEEVSPCGDTCERPLSCGQHTCSMRCHRGSCETCRQVTHTHTHTWLPHTHPPPSLPPQVVEKSCRCGKHRKLMPCHKEYLCESKCPQTRSCGRHQCRRKVSGGHRVLTPPTSPGG